MKTEEIKKNHRILILGYGIEGKATEQYLRKFHPRAIIGIADQKDGSEYLEEQSNYDLVIKSPGIHKQLVTKPYTTATNIFFANAIGTTIGVTGTKGKSTTASLIDHILKTAGLPSHLVGNIGNPMLFELIQSNKKEDIFVCELSSYQLEDIKFSPHISVVLNMFPDHMNHHGSIQKYYQAKLNIVKHSIRADYFIYNPNYAFLENAASGSGAKSLPFVGDISLDTTHIKIMGAHNIENIRAAITVVKLFSVTNDTIQMALNSYNGLPHRLEYIGVFNNIHFYDDASSTTPQSTIASIETLKEVDTIFLGGQNRGYDFSLLAETINQSSIRNVVLFPDAAGAIKRALGKYQSPRLNIQETDRMRTAILFALKNTKINKICLLSTACPSYSLWKNFSIKGDEFQHLVAQLAKKS